MNQVYDVAIIGSGVAGTFATLRIAEKYPEAKAVILDIGKGPQKRKRALEGFLGCFPSGDGKLYPGDLEAVKNVADGRKAAPTAKWVMDHFAQVDNLKLIKSNKPKLELKKKISELGFETQFHDYYQWKPKNIHSLSRNISMVFKDKTNLEFKFETEVFSIRKQNESEFILETSTGSVIAKKIILAAGRSGWRWVTNVFDDLQIIAHDDYAKYGVRVEVPIKFMKNFNYSHLSMIKDDLEIGPLLWNGTIIQEDHSDLIISSFRSNEERWKTEKVSFSVLKKVYFENMGSVETDRVGKLSCILFNERVSKEKIRLFLKKQSQLNLMPEFNWLHGAYNILNEMIPEINKASHYAPDLCPMPAQVNLGPNLETEIDGLFVAGESAALFGIVSAAITGAICADSACK